MEKFWLVSNSLILSPFQEEGKTETMMGEGLYHELNLEHVILF